MADDSFIINANSTTVKGRTGRPWETSDRSRNGGGLNSNLGRAIYAPSHSRTTVITTLVVKKSAG